MGVSNGFAYAAIKGTEDFTPITDKKGTHLGDKSYAGWTMIGADKLDGVNTTVWKHNNGE